MEKWNMEINGDSGANYRAARADAAQTACFVDTLYKPYQEKRERIIVFTADDENGENVGHLIIEEKPVPTPIGGTDWFVWNITARPDLRRRGIASAVLREAKTQAAQAGVRHIVGSANPTERACGFWLSHGFCFYKYGKRHEDASAPLSYGNYSHMIFYRVDRRAREMLQPEGFRVIEVGRERLNRVMDECGFDAAAQILGYDMSAIFGLVAVDGNDNAVGVIAGYAEEMYAPLVGFQWCVPYMFVRPEVRRRGIGSALVRGMMRRAEDAGAAQLLCANPNEEYAGFWNANCFDMIFARHMAVASTTVLAAKRIGRRADARRIQGGESGT
jgi:GNAT superfamily N-acetyltransferase